MLRLGAFGTGMVFERYARAAAQLPGIEIVAVCDLDPVRRGRAARFGSRVCETEQELLAQPIDAVLVLTPNATHRQLVKACLEAGLPTLCEKPLATSAADAAQMAGWAEALGVPLFPAFHLRHRPEIKYLSQQLGSPVAHFEQIWLEDWRDAPAWYFQRAESGGGVLIDVGTNLIDWIGQLVPPLRLVNVVADTEAEVEHECTAHWSFESGSGSTHLSWRGAPEQRLSRVVTRSEQHFELLHDQRCVRHDGVLHGPWQADEYVGVLQEFRAHLQAPDPSCARKAAADLELLAEAYLRLGLPSPGKLVPFTDQSP